jgi:DivIVA domain-containing protein
VRNTKFSTTRMRAGYDMDEVDAFLDIVEADVAQYSDDLQRSRDGEAVLRTQCDQLQVRLGMAEQKLADAQAELAELQSVRAHQTEPIVLPLAVEEPVAAVQAGQGVDAVMEVEAPVVQEPPTPTVDQLGEPELPADVAAAVAADPEAASVVAIAERHADEIVRFAQTRADSIRASVRTMLTDQMVLVDRS